MNAQDIVADALTSTLLSDGSILPSGIPAGPYQHGMAAAALAALETAGYVIMAPQDIEWGACPGHDDGGPHRVSLNLCATCLEYDPE